MDCTSATFKTWIRGWCVACCLQHTRSFSGPERRKSSGRVICCIIHELLSVKSLLACKVQFSSDKKMCFVRVLFLFIHLSSACHFKKRGSSFAMVAACTNSKELRCFCLFLQGLKHGRETISTDTKPGIQCAKVWKTTTIQSTI